MRNEHSSVEDMNNVSEPRELPAIQGQAQQPSKQATSKLQHLDPSELNEKFEKETLEATTRLQKELVRKMPGAIRLRPRFHSELPPVPFLCLDGGSLDHSFCHESISFPFNAQENPEIKKAFEPTPQVSTLSSPNRMFLVRKQMEGAAAVENQSLVMNNR